MEGQVGSVTKGNGTRRFVDAVAQPDFGGGFTIEKIWGDIVNYYGKIIPDTSQEM